METIKDKEFSGERPLFETHDTELVNVTIGTGESALKECSNIVARDCRFEGKYPFWHVDGFKIERCLFTEGARACFMVLPECGDDRYPNRGSQDVPNDGRHHPGECEDTSCAGNSLGLP